MLTENLSILSFYNRYRELDQRYTLSTEEFQEYTSLQNHLNNALKQGAIMVGDKVLVSVDDHVALLPVAERYP